MNANEHLIQTLYDALKRLDYQTMQSCYHPEAHFEDPAFGRLNYRETCAMWEMLCRRAGKLSLSYSAIKADDKEGSGHLVASYVFSTTKKSVVNTIDSHFTFKEGKILSQKDTFSLWKWSRQALGGFGLFLGWLPPFQNKIRKEMRKNLDYFISQQVVR